MDIKLRALNNLDRWALESWTDLGGRALESNPFFEPSFVLPLARHYGLEMSVLTVAQGADLVFCLPFFRGTTKWQGLPLPAWRTWNPLSTPLVDKADPEAIMAAAIEYCLSCDGPNVLVLDFLPTDGPVAAAFEAATRSRGAPWPSKERKASDRPIMFRREDGAYLDSTLRGERKRALRRKRERLEDSLGGPLTVVEDNGTEAIERLLAMEAAGWKGRIGRAVANDSRHAPLFREACAGFAREGRLQLLSYRTGSTTLAMKADLRSGHTMFGLRTAYDERFKKCSPGVQLEIEAVAVFHASGDQLWDSCTNHEKNPQSWLWPERREFRRFIVTL